MVSQGGGQGAGAGAEFEIPREGKPGKKQGVTPSTKQRNHLRGAGTRDSVPFLDLKPRLWWRQAAEQSGAKTAV